MAFDLASVLRDVPDLGTDREQIEYIKLELLDSDPNNFYQLSDIPQLADNIATCKLQQPIRVRPAQDGRYQIVSGHRRRAALEMLVNDGYPQFAEVPCIVERDTASPSLQQLRLIYANAHTRKLTPAEVSKQAQEVEKLLYQLAEEGYDFPGRMRDHVAQAVGVSKSKLSRLKVIREKLAEFWMPYFEDNSIHEITANLLAQLPNEEQYRVYEYIMAKYNRPGAVTSSVVETYRDRIAGMNDLICPTEGIPCENMDDKRDATIRCGIYEFHPCAKCCAVCHKLTSCRYACPKLADQIAAVKAEQREQRRQEKEAKTAEDAPRIAQVTSLWRRFGQLRAQAGKSVEDVFRATGYSYSQSNVRRYPDNEAGLKIDATTSLPYPGSVFRSDVNTLINIADLFGCSLDYLLCHTDADGPKPSDSVPESGTIWHPISEEPPIGVDLVWLDGQGYSDTGVYCGGQSIESVCTITWPEARWWARLPEEDT